MAAHARTQQPTMPVIGILNGGSPDEYAHFVAAFLKSFSEAGYVEGVMWRLTRKVESVSHVAS
jgi:hypothetical protein